MVHNLFGVIGNVVKKFFKPKPKPNIGVLAGITGDDSTSGMPSPTPSGGSGGGTFGGGGGGSGGGGGGTPNPWIGAGIGTTQGTSGGGTSGGGISIQDLSPTLTAQSEGLTNIQKFEASKDLMGKIDVFEQAGLSKKQATALAKREFIRREAKRRGRGFTQFESRRFLGGGMGVSALRTATRGIKKAGVSKEFQDFLKGGFREISIAPSTTLFTKDLDLNTEPFTAGNYDPRTGMFISPSKTGFGATGILRTPTPSEQIKIDVAQKKGKIGVFESPKDVLDFGTQFASFPYLPLTPKEQSTLGDYFLNPIGQYKVFKSRKEFDEAIKEANKIVDKLEKEDKKFENKWGNIGIQNEKFKNKWENLISENQFTGTKNQYDEFLKDSNKLSKQNNEYSKDFNKLSAQFNFYTKNQKFQKALADSESRTTIFQRIKESNISEGKKRALSVLAGAGQFIPYFSAPISILYGVESIASGTEAFPKAQTLGQKARATGEIGIGLILAKSGLSGLKSGVSILGKAGTGETVTSRLAKMERDYGFTLGGRAGGLAQRSLQLAESRGGRFVTRAGIPTLFAGTQAIDVYSQTEDLALSLSAGLGGLTTIIAPRVYGGIRGGTKPTKLEKQKLSEKINKLENSRLNDLTIVREGAGSKPNTDRVNIMINQKVGNFDRIIRISGDLRRGEKGLIFFPKGKGEAITLGSIKVKGQLEKGFVDKQRFNINEVSEGINLGRFEGYQIGTTQSISQNLPKGQINTFFKVPKGRGIVLSARTSMLKIKEFLRKKKLQKGGEIVTTLEPRDRLFTIRKEQGLPETEPSSKKLKEFDITEISQALGRFAGKRPIKYVGTTISEERLGAFMLLGEPPKVNVIRAKGKIKKTPLSKTFQEPKIKTDLASPKIEPPKQKQVQIERDIPKEITAPEIEKFTEKIMKTTRKELKGKTQKAVEKLDTISTSIPATAYGGVKISVTKQKIKQVSKIIQKEKLDTAITDVQKELLGLGEKINLAERQTTKQVQKQVQQQLLEEPMMMGVRPPLKLEPPKTRARPFLFAWGGKRRAEKKPTAKKGYDVYIKPLKKKKYLKITKNPVGLTEARDTRNYFLDETISKIGYIKPTKEKANKLMFDIPKGYARDTDFKFQTFKQKKGKRIRLKIGKVLEKSKYLLDSPSEVKQLSIFKAMAQAEKRKIRKRKSKKPIGLSFA